MLSLVEHEKSFITSGPGMVLTIFGYSSSLVPQL